MRRRRREGALLSRQLTRDRFSSRVDGHSGGRARAATAARGTGETGRARSHGGFVDSRAVRRRKGVSRRPREARGSRARRRRGVTRSLKHEFRSSALARATSSSVALSTFVCELCGRSRTEFEDAGPHCVRNFPPASFSLAILQVQNMAVPEIRANVVRRTGQVGRGPWLAGAQFCCGPRFEQKAAVPGHGSQIRLYAATSRSRPAADHLPERLREHLVCSSRSGDSPRRDTYKQRWRVWCVTLSRRRRDAGVAVVVFERPSTPPAGFAATAVLRDYIKTKFFVM